MFGQGSTLTGEDWQSARGTAGSLVMRWIFPDDTPKITVIRDGRMRVGRDPGLEVCLPGDEVSRVHAELEGGAQPSITDSGSRNGTFVNGERVRQSQLRVGDLVRVGEWLGLVDVVRDPPHPVFTEMAPRLFAGGALAAGLETVRRAAASLLPIVLQGETGTGKERVARAIHLWSGRSGPFVAVNCAALPATLVEAELFGFRKGAFTGAQNDSLGLFRAAEGGTLLLDEIVELPLALQAKILRALEEKEVLPLGTTRPVPIDIRIVTAAQQSLAEATSAGRFRADLMARLDGLTLVLPRLRERKAELPRLFRVLLAKHWSGALPSSATVLMEQLCLYEWPFNVRELDLVCQHLAALHGGKTALSPSDLPAKLRDRPVRLATPPTGVPAAQFSNDDQALELLIGQLRESKGNLTRAVEALGISRQRAYRLLQARPDIDLDQFRRPSGDDAP
ncbi:MAG TPA: sigma 54-interacting transcriptional regulator [Polyangiaceae bacterium]|nr:sigma 54-interacting transcriptional regulator [Polyangiaceae bacterium]